MDDWTLALAQSKKDQEKFVERGKKIVKRFRDERGSVLGSSEKRYNILWSNVKTLFPAVYAKKPKAEVERRNKDKDPIGRTASAILERALQYEIDHYTDYDSALRNCVMDRLLPGRGVAWIRFDAGDATAQVTDDVQESEQPPQMGLASLLGPPQPEPTDPKDYECTPCDYVYWEDFRHSPARTWEEVTWVARRVYMGKDDLAARFPDAGDVPMVHEPVGLDDHATAETDGMKKAIVWEVWDKPSETVCWYAEGKKEPLDERPDPLELDGFFPCPKPLFATTTTDTMVPVADFIEYQDQALELDELTTRINLLTKAVKVVGVYDASQTGIQRMLNEGVDNTLIPVDTWAAFGQQGGIKGSVEFLPLEMVVGALNELYKARDICKNVIYEITGMSDILRGVSDPIETATAQNIKSSYGSLRLKEVQQDVAIFASDLLKKKAQVMAQFYRPETLIAMSGIMETEDAQYAQPAVEMLKNSTMRSYRIEIATDSMVQMDEQQEKASRVEFLTAAGGFLKEAVQAAQMSPALAPLLGEMLMFGVRAFPASRPLESAFEQFVSQTAEQAQQPRPNPEMIKIQGQMQIEQSKAQSKFQIEQIKAQVAAQSQQAQLAAQAQAKQAEIQANARLEAMKTQFQVQADEANRAHEAQLEQMKMNLQAQVDRARDESQAAQETLKIQHEAQLAQIEASYKDKQHQDELDMKWQIEQLKAATTIEAANISSKAKLNDDATASATNEVKQALPKVDPSIEALAKTAQQLTDVADKLSKPRVRVLHRGPDGKPTHSTESIEE